MGMQFRKDGETIGYELDLRNLQVKPIYALEEDFRGERENGEFQFEDVRPHPVYEMEIC